MTINQHPPKGDKDDKRQIKPVSAASSPDAETIRQRELTVALHNSDGEAFGRFYVKYSDSLIRFLTKIMGNQEDAKEVVQDTFVILWENRERVNPHSTLEGYIFGTAKNLAFRMMRVRNRECDVSSEIGMMQDEYADLADGQLITEEMALIIELVLGRMSPKKREVFELSRNEGLTYNEIAERLNITYGTVRSHIESAKKEIRSALAIVMAYLLFVSQ